MKVIAVVATFRRPRELARLVDSLSGIDAIVVCDNAANAEIRALVERAPCRAHYIAPAANLGCGGGLRLAETYACQAESDWTHLLVLDDDAVLAPDTVSTLLAALEREQAHAAYPLVTGADGRTGWLPGLRDPQQHRLGRKPMAVERYRSLLGATVADFDWAQGICLLVTRPAVEEAGFHRDDFWVRGEDLDFSLRLTAHGRGIFVPASLVQHLPPGNPGSAGTHADYLRHAAMVQNIAFLALTQPHGRRIRHSIPSASLRFVRTWGLGALPDLFSALHRGRRGEPAGYGTAETFRQRLDEVARG
jgi:rhamnopyranosyl-N-acetylglucosaminyl-diphospho-decaprenol beta-1,3/1,4-galactofuranosyltransferase